MPSRVVDALGRAQTRGLVGPGDLEAHVSHALGFVEVLLADGAPSTILDLGSGGGLPGLVIAGVLEGASVTLLDSSERRCRLLRAAVEACGFGARVRVHHERAETAAHRPDLRGTFDAAVARAFGPPPVTAECGAPFVRRGGELVVSEPPPGDAAGGSSSEDAQAAEGRWPAAGLALVGLEAAPPVPAPFTFKILRRTGDCPERYPRRPGVPAKRPLF